MVQMRAMTDGGSLAANLMTSRHSSKHKKIHQMQGLLPFLMDSLLYK